MNELNKDIESIGDSIGLNINSHSAFGASMQPSSLTPVLSKQSPPEDPLNKFEKRI